jgi:UDPglucose 6-dehydrogenase
MLMIYDPKVSKEKIISDLKYLWESYSFSENKINELLLKVNVLTCPYEASVESHALVFLTEWDEFKILNFNKIYNKMNKPSFIFDGRKILNQEKLISEGFKCFELGKV